MGMVYVGTVGTDKVSASVTGNGKGVYSFRLEGDTLTEAGVIEAENAGIICASPDGSHIYAANETRDFDSGLPGSGGGVTAFAVTDETLEKVGESISYGSRPSNVAVSDDGRFLLVANHGSHSAVICRYVEDGQGD